MIHSIKETYLDFFAFLKNPNEQQDPIQTTQQKVKRLFSILAIEIPIMGILITLVYGIEKLGLIDTEKHKMTLMFEQYPIWLIILLGVLIMPLVEELIFRLYLRFKYNYLARLIIKLVSLTGKQNGIAIESYLVNFWTTYFRLIFYFSAILFGLVHITNFEFSKNILLFTPLLIAPQVIIGLFLGYLRIKYNFLLGYFLHAIHNAIFLVIPLVFMTGAEEKLNIENKNYSLKVEEIQLNQNASSKVDDNSISFTSTTLKTVLAFLLDKDENLIQSSNTQLSNKRINLSFKNHLKDNSTNKKVILENLSQAYGLSIESKLMQQDIWELDLLDSLLLFKHQVPNENSSSISVSSNEIIMVNADLDQAVQSLSSNYNLYFANKTGLSSKFDLALPKKDFANLEKILNSKYGLSLKKSKKEIAYTFLKFEK